VADLGPEPSSNEAALWLVKAADDLAVAEVVQASPIGANWAACFHAQQAAEKALRALLVLLGIDFPRTHVLERIADLLPPELAASFDREAIILGRSLVATPRTSAIQRKRRRPRSCTRHEQS